MLIWTHDSLRFLTCPFLFPPTCILNPLPLLLLGEEWISWPLVFLPAFFPLFRSHSLTLSLYHVLPYLPSYLSPTCLLILSPLPCFFPGLRHLGRRGEFFSSFLSFLPCPCSLSQRFLHFSPHSCCSRFWDPRFPLSPMCSHLCPYLANFFLLAVLSRL